MISRIALLLAIVVSLGVPASGQVPAATLIDLRAKMKAGFGQKVRVEQRGRAVHITLATRTIDDATYLSTLRAACGHLGRRSSLASEIAILNDAGAQGRVFASPAQCEAVANSKMTDAAILAATHPF